MSTKSKQILNKKGTSKTDVSHRQPTVSSQRKHKGHQDSSDIENYKPIRMQHRSNSRSNPRRAASDHSLPDNNSSPYRQHREQLSNSPMARNELSKSPGAFSKSSQSSPYVKSTVVKNRMSSAKRVGFSGVKQPKYIGTQSSADSRSRSRSRSRSKSQPGHISNQDDVQVVRDTKGIKRKIEYFDETSAEPESTARKLSSSPITK